MKDEKKSIIVILGMAFLIIMIILPPLFRAVFPKTEKYDNQQNLDKTEVLTCERVISNSDYSTSVSVRYKNGEAIENTITYFKVDDSIKANATEGKITPEEESSYFSKLNDINIVTENDKVVVVVNKTSLENNANDNTLPKYLQPLSDQEQFYSELGYNCSIDTK